MEVLKHIAIVTTSYPLNHDGSEAAGVFVADLVEKLSETIKVTVVAPGQDNLIELIGDNLRVQRYFSPHLPLSLLRASNPFHWPIIYQILKNGIEALGKIAKQEALDHIFALWVLPSGYWAYKVGKRFQIPYSTWALGSDIWTLSKIPAVKSILRKVLKNSFLNFADGYQLQNDVKIISERSCLFLPSTRGLSITTKKRFSNSPPYRLVFLGRWHRNKGIDLFLKSLKLLKEESWDLIQDVRIFGGGPLQNSVEKNVKALIQLRRPVSMGGYLDTFEAINLLQSSDYLMIPSRIESTPVIFSDAMKCGCPIVAMPVGDLPYLIKEFRCGICAEEVSAGAFSEALQEILSFSPEKFEKDLKRAGESFNNDVVARTLCDCFFKE